MNEGGDWEEKGNEVNKYVLHEGRPLVLTGRGEQEKITGEIINNIARKKEKKSQNGLGVHAC